VDVIPRRITRCSPKAKMEFTIDLKYGTKPIARTHYWMSTPELQELKMQLRELLDLGLMSKCVTSGCAYYSHTEEGWVVEDSVLTTIF
jgi:hypothetical protein